MKIGLALSGGGVLGVAHLGVINELCRKNIKIDTICGTSAGAIIGALYAAGGVSRIERFIDYLEGQGLFGKGKIMLPGNVEDIVKKALTLFLEGSKFGNLRVRFSCVTTDAATGETVILEKGDLIEAVTASFSYPGFFPIKKIDGRFLFDGGVLLNYPVEILKKQKLDFIIGSYLGKVSTIDTKNLDKLKLSRFGTYSRAIDMAQDKMSQANLRLSDFNFVPPVEIYSWNQFDKMSEIRQIGYDYAAKRIKDLQKNDRF
jgi:NTE family protein